MTFNDHIKLQLHIEENRKRDAENRKKYFDQKRKEEDHKKEDHKKIETQFAVCSHIERMIG